MVSLFPEPVCERNVENAGCARVSSRPGLVQKHVLEEAKTCIQHIAKSIHQQDASIQPTCHSWIFLFEGAIDQVYALYEKHSA